MVYSARHDKCLSLRGQNVVAETCNTSTAQTWAWSAYDQLVSVATGQCLDVDGEADEEIPLRLSRCCKEKSGQQWSCSGGLVRPGTKNLSMSYGNRQDVVNLILDTGPNSQWKIFGENRSNICTKKPGNRSAIDNIK